MAMASEQAGLTGVKGSIVRKTAVGGRFPISRTPSGTLRRRWKVSSRRSKTR